MRGSGEESRESNTALGIEEPQATTEHLVATISLSPQCNLGAMCSGSLVRILVNLIRLWESRNLNVFMYMCLQVYHMCVHMCIIYVPATVSLFISVCVSVFVSVSNSLADYQWYLVCSPWYPVSGI